MDGSIRGHGHGQAVDDSIILSKPELAAAGCVRDDNNSVNSAINVMTLQYTPDKHNPTNGNELPSKPGPSSVRMSEHSIHDKLYSKDSESMS